MTPFQRKLLIALKCLNILAATAIGIWPQSGYQQYLAYAIAASSTLGIYLQNQFSTTPSLPFADSQQTVIKKAP